MDNYSQIHKESYSQNTHRSKHSQIVHKIHFKLTKTHNPLKRKIQPHPFILGYPHTYAFPIRRGFDLFLLFFSTLFVFLFCFMSTDLYLYFYKAVINPSIQILI